MKSHQGEGWQDIAALLRLRWEDMLWSLRPGDWGSLAGGITHSLVLPAGVGEACTGAAEVTVDS